MKITVDKESLENNTLQFVITVSDVETLPFTPEEISTLMGILTMTKNLLQPIPENSILYRKIVESSSQVKEYIFNKMMRELKATIHDILEPRFDQMCQEIYNFHYDLQPEYIRSWMSDYDNVRTEYYFDNDVRKKRNESDQEKEFNIDIDDGDDEDHN